MVFTSSIAPLDLFSSGFCSPESTALTLAATVAYLAVNPDIQKDIVEQIVSVVGWEGRPVSSSLVLDRNVVDDRTETSRASTRIPSSTKFLQHFMKLLDSSVSRVKCSHGRD